jgi:hypothetical protein
VTKTRGSSAANVESVVDNAKDNGEDYDSSNSPA